MFSKESRDSRRHYAWIQLGGGGCSFVQAADAATDMLQLADLVWSRWARPLREDGEES